MKRLTRRSALIALLTDFGSKDSFVGTMKAVILGINPRATIVDLTHEIPPQDVDSAAYVLWSSYNFFPKETIFVAVVDPGVGTKRKILCVEGTKHIFLAPDNGLLKYLASDGELKRIWEVKNKKYFLSEVSSTFQGRDILAPVAAHLSSGLKPENLGRRVRSVSSEKEFIYLNGRSSGKHLGKVIYVDHFGNLITNFRLASDTTQRWKSVRVRIRDRAIEGLSRSYSDGSPGGPSALVNSSGLLEIGLRNGNAAKFLKASAGEKVTIEFPHEGKR